MHRPFRKTQLGKLTRRATTKWLRLQKWLYWRMLAGPPDQRQVVLIVGCQRSGTTLLGQVFDKDFRTTVLHEESPITGAGGHRLRLRPYDEVNGILAAVPTPLIVAKPLVESQHTPEMLREIPGSKAVWMFRHYRDAAHSNVNRFSTQIKHLKSVIDSVPESLDTGNWRTERVSRQTRALLAGLFSDRSSPYDAAALMWYARNVLFFDLGLDAHPDVTMCRYEDLVTRPAQTVQSIYRFLGVDYPRREVADIVDSRSVRLGRSVELHEGVGQLCRGLLERLDRNNQLRQPQLEENGDERSPSMSNTT